MTRQQSAALHKGEMRVLRCVSWSLQFPSWLVRSDAAWGVSSIPCEFVGVGLALPQGAASGAPTPPRCLTAMLQTIAV
jgi:hypothetical protein